MAATRSRGVSRVVIGVDPHKRIDAVVVLDETEAVLARETIEHSSSGFRTLMGLARRFPRRTWAVEGCNGGKEPGSAAGGRRGDRAGRVDPQVLAGAGVGDQLRAQDR